MAENDLPAEAFEVGFRLSDDWIGQLALSKSKLPCGNNEQSDNKIVDSQQLKSKQKLNSRTDRTIDVQCARREKLKQCHSNLVWTAVKKYGVLGQFPISQIQSATSLRTDRRTDRRTDYQTD